MNNTNGQRKCWRCGLPEPVLKLVKHTDGQMHLTCDDCAEAVEEMRVKIAPRVAELKKLAEQAG